MRPLLKRGDTLMYSEIGPCVVEEMTGDDVYLRELNPSRYGRGDMICIPIDEFCQTVDSVRNTIERHALPIGLRVTVAHAMYEVLGAPGEGAEEGQVLLVKVEGAGPVIIEVPMDTVVRSKERAA